MRIVMPGACAWSCFLTRYRIARPDTGLGTSDEFTRRLEGAGIQISMDGRGRALDNIIFVERLWRSVKYEEVYLRDYADGAEAWRGLHRYLVFYNTARRHQSLDRRTPAEVHFG